jgi:hypothetical protein
MYLHWNLRFHSSLWKKTRDVILVIPSQHENKILHKFFKTLFYLYFMQLFIADLTMFKKIKKSFFAHENMKKLRSKVAQNRPQTFFSQVWPSCPNQPRIDFSYYQNVSWSVCRIQIGMQIKSTLQNFITKINGILF